jgi:hypothetical protein
MAEPGARAGRWDRLAARLGLAPVRRRRLFRDRTRLLVGERSGYLVSVVPKHSLNQSRVDLFVRFPQRSTIRGLREDLLKDEALLKAFGRRKRLPKRRRKNFHVGDGSVLLRLPYAVVPPTASRIERALDGLVGAMSRHVRPLDRACEQCAGKADLGVFLVDDLPAIFCEPCVAAFDDGERVADELFDEEEPDFGRGAWVGLAGAGAFGLLGGALAALGPILAPALALPLAALLFAAAGYATSAVAARAFEAPAWSATVARLALALVAAAVGWTAMNAVATMTLRPAIWNLTLLWGSSWGAATAAPRDAAILAGAAAAGWLVELVQSSVHFRPRAKRVRVERVP